ncbi:effector-binding domain-containing protein [Microbacterium sp. AK009]|uniref:GyrI-like domain-containing protein n=1 Tax=Microbacterium sp. AK009 TaxID=2723068 RepID=UPI0017B3802E|nr:GyrI-like domain-containing protein [Microbacterium sp. AK009]NYF17767.1 effector-binding domain-containing protein [Microbacterium sp. AK009]
MSEDVRIVDHAVELTAGVRRRVPMSELTDFFAAAFTETARALAEQGVAPIGPPFGKYYGVPDTAVDVEAGFPVAGTVRPLGNVSPGVLPAGPVAEAMHVGPYDTMDQTYAAVQRHCAAVGMTPGPVSWEQYLSDPEAEPDPTRWRTLIRWPVVESAAG